MSSEFGARVSWVQILKLGYLALHLASKGYITVPCVQPGDSVTPNPLPGTVIGYVNNEEGKLVGILTINDKEGSRKICCYTGGEESKEEQDKFSAVYDEITLSPDWPDPDVILRRAK